MVPQTLFTILLNETGLIFCSVSSKYVDYVASSSWDGVSFNIAVRRDTIQEKLDAYHNSVSNECGKGPKLFIPEKPVFPDLETRDHHPVYVSFGYVTSHDFDDYLKDDPNPCIAISGLKVGVTIPLLAANSTGTPAYTMVIAKLYEKSRGDIPKTNFLYPYIPVDENQLNDSEAILRNGSDELKVFFVRNNHPCNPLPFIVKEEFDEYITGEFHVGLPEPVFSFCDQHSFGSSFCTNAKRVKCAVHRYSPNICQKYKTFGNKFCEAAVEVVNITSNFCDLILLRNDPVNILASQSYSCNLSFVGLIYPCQD